MAERFERLFSLPDNLYKNNAPVAILAGALLKDQKTGAIIAQLKFQNISTKVIKALKISLLASDVTGEISCGTQEYQYLDLSVDQGEIFGSDKAIVISDRNSRMFAIGSVTVVFADSAIWEGNGDTFYALPPLILLNKEHDDEIVKQYKLATTKKATYVPQDNGNMWLCTCGGINENDTCPHCKCKKQTVFSSYDISALTVALNERLEKQRIQDEQEERQRKRKKVRIIIIASIILAIILVFYCFNAYSIANKQKKYEKAVELTKDGKYAQAIAIYNEIGDTGYGYSLCQDALNGSFSHVINYYNLDSFVIPDGVTTIRSDAFANCEEITSVTIPKSVEVIEPNAFKELRNLTSVHISDIASWCKINFDSHDDNPLYYAKKLYLNGELITKLVIPDNVTSIGDYAFYNCESLTSVTISDSITSIGDYEFYGCSSLTSVTLSDSVTNIGDYAFYGCSSLTSVMIPDGVTSIGNNAFHNCSGLTSITIPFVGENADGTGAIHFGYIFGASYPFQNAYYVCTNLKTVVITGGKSIGDDAFYKCSGLTSIIVPNSVTSIGEGAFDGCSSLTSITIPFVGVTKDGSSNTRFEDIFKESSLFYGDYVPISLKTVIITGGTSIGNLAFYSCKGLTSVTIPDTVTSVGYSAFSNCNSLTSIIFQGTKAQWRNVISEYIFGFRDTEDITIYCVDGNIRM